MCAPEYCCIFQEKSDCFFQFGHFFDLYPHGEKYVVTCHADKLDVSE